MANNGNAYGYAGGQGFGQGNGVGNDKGPDHNNNSRFPIPSYYARDATAGVRHVADREPHEAKARAKETLIHPVGPGSRLATFRTNTA